MVGTLTYWHVWGNKPDPNFQQRHLFMDSYMLKGKCLPYCNLPQPLVKHMSSVESKLRKLLEVGKQAG